MHRLLKIFIAATVVIATTLSEAAPVKKNAPKKTKKTSSNETQYLKPDPITETVTNTGLPKVRAASFVVIDAKTGSVLHEKNSEQPRPPASTQKLLAALIIAETGDLDQKVRVEPSDTWAEPTKLYLRPGDTYKRLQLLQILLVKSMNDVARCLARDNAGTIENFAAKMNQKAMELGAVNSHFVNPNGLPAPGQFSTARDLSRIARAAYVNPVIRSIVCKKTLSFHYADGRVKEFTNTNRVLRNYSLCNGMKTGYTEAAGFCLIASGANAGRDIIVVVLGDTKEWVWKDAYALLVWGLSS